MMRDGFQSIFEMHTFTMAKGGREICGIMSIQYRKIKKYV